MQITKRYCDICHAELRDEIGHPVYYTVTKHGNGNGNFDICYSCWRKLMEYKNKIREEMIVPRVVTINLGDEL